MYMCLLKVSKELLRSIINSLGIALPTLKIISCVGNARQVLKDIAQKNVKNSQYHIQDVDKYLDAFK